MFTHKKNPYENIIPEVTFNLSIIMYIEIEKRKVASIQIIRSASKLLRNALLQGGK